MKHGALAYADSAAQPDPFKSVRPEDELLHQLAPDAQFGATETSYFGFNIPEERINGEIYVWFHPALGVVSGGVWFYQGHKKWHLGAEYHDYRLYMPIPKDISSYELPNGLRIKVIEPLKSLELQFEDKFRKTRLDLRLDGIMPPAGRGNGGHLTQAMRTKGELTLRGKKYKIDGFTSRDRSWGESRSEAPQAIPPLSWMVGVFDADFAVHATAFDSRELHPEWAGLYSAPKEGENLLWGYVWREGQLLGVSRAKTLVHTESDGITPRAVDLDLVDVTGREYAVRGTIEARCPWMSWQNLHTFFCQTRWECDGRIGWGDTQNVVYGDHIWRFGK
jgi:hypothetical protein